MLHSTAKKIDSHIPRFPPILPSICIHSNTRGVEKQQKWGRLGSIHHVSEQEIDEGGGLGGRGGRGADLYVLNLRSSFADHDK